MSEEDQIKLARLMATADSRCATCVGELFDLAAELWPEVAWDDLRERADKWAEWRRESVWDDEAGPEPQ